MPFKVRLPGGSNVTKELPIPDHAESTAGLDHHLGGLGPHGHGLIEPVELFSFLERQRGHRSLVASEPSHAFLIGTDAATTAGHHRLDQAMPPMPNVPPPPPA
jgi:hypothetical protein